MLINKYVLCVHCLRSPDVQTAAMRLIIVLSLALFVFRSELSLAEAAEGWHIGELLSVRLTVPPDPKRNADGSITISNSCGSADVEYKLVGGGTVHSKMILGEWCRHPYDERPRDRQLIFLEADGTLAEFYGIKQFQDGPEYVVIKSPRLRELLRVNTPQNGVFLFTLEDDNDLRDFENGVDESEDLAIVGHDVFSKYAVYLEDISIAGEP